MSTRHYSHYIHGQGWIAATLLLMAGLFALPCSAMAMEEMILIRSVAKNPQRPPVRFFHDAHNEKAEIEDCSFCHHVYEDGKLVEGESSEEEPCSSCHPANPEKGQLGFMRAFHKRCITCHDKEGKGPLTCGGCHVKKS